MSQIHYSQGFERVFFGRSRNKTQILRLTIVRSLLVAGTCLGRPVLYRAFRAAPDRWQAGELF